MADYIHFPEFSIRVQDVYIHVDLSWLDQRVRDAQFALDNAIMDSMIPYMPIRTGTLIQNTRGRSEALAGTGIVVAAAPPYGRYLYFGKKMVDSRTGKGPMYIPNIGYRYKERAVLMPTDQPLTYSNPSATPEWFETAKQNHFDEWVKVVERKIAGG